MTKQKVVYTPRREKTKPLKMMHKIDHNSDGTFSINTPKLKEAVGPVDPALASEQAAETGHKAPKPKTVSKPPTKTTNGELDHKILSALEALGGKDVASIDIAKKAGTTRTHSHAPRAPIRAAMERSEKLGYVKSERKGIKYLFSITEKGKASLKSGPTDANHHPPAAETVKAAQPVAAA